MSTRRVADRVEAVAPADILTVEGAQPESEMQGTDKVMSDDGRKKVIRRRKKRRRVRLAPLLFLGGWAIAVMLLVIFVKNRGRKNESALVANPQVAEDSKERAKRAKMGEFIGKELPACQLTLFSFLASKTMEKRAQFVRDSTRLAPNMNAWYMTNPPLQFPKDGKLVLKSTNLFIHSEGTVLETVFGIEGETVHDKEIAFVREDGRWVIDWEALVKFSKTPWREFVKDTENSQGEFRLFVRRGTGAIESERPVMILQFYPPRDDKLKWRLASNRVVVPLDTENGRRMAQIFARSKTERELGESRYGLKDPDDLYRVRVVLYWDSTADEQRIIKLGKVLAGNWMGRDFEEDFQDQEEPEENGEVAPKEEGPRSEKEGRPSEEEDNPSQGSGNPAVSG
ncbi:MAG: hypothetical protein VCA34_11665 [Roseibacillus sp.]